MMLVFINQPFAFITSCYCPGWLPLSFLRAFITMYTMMIMNTTTNTIGSMMIVLMIIAYVYLQIIVPNLCPQDVSAKWKFKLVKVIDTTTGS
jgi:hypothetical protein